MMRYVTTFWLLCLPSSGQTADGVTLTFLADVLRATPAAFVSAFVCWKSGRLAVFIKCIGCGWVLTIRYWTLLHVFLDSF
jgi:hypothetical protein